jgi:hypothetical protein
MLLRGTPGFQDERLQARRGPRVAAAPINAIQPRAGMDDLRSAALLHPPDNRPLILGIRVINRSPKPSGRITRYTRVIIAVFFDPICGDDHPCITRSVRLGRPQDWQHRPMPEASLREGLEPARL